MPETLILRGDHMTLAQAVKVTGQAASGGQAKALVRGGGVTVNGRVTTQPGHKLVRGDLFAVAGGPEYVLGQEPAAGS